MEAKEILRKLVSFNTIRDNQNKEIMDFIENYLKGFGFETKRIKKCLIAYNDVTPNIGFIGHTDTVDYESWDGNPFELKEVVYFLISFSSVKIGFNSFFLLKADNVLLINVDLDLFVSVLINVFSNFDGMDPKFVLVKAV